MIRIFFGNPGCGKTTCMIRNMKKMQKYPKSLHYNCLLYTSDAADE